MSKSSHKDKSQTAVGWAGRPLVLVAIAMIAAPGVASSGSYAKDLVPAAKSLHKLRPNDGTKKISDERWICSPMEYCEPSTVAGRCISLKEGVTCHAQRVGGAADR